MAEIVFAIGASHTPMIHTPAEQWTMHAARDHRNTALDFRGKLYTFDELCQARAAENLAAECTPSIWQAKQQRFADALERLRQAYIAAAPDVVVIFGDDQNELYTAKNMPALSVFWGERAYHHAHVTETTPKGGGTAAAPMVGEESYEIATDLARHVIGRLMAEDFDLAQMGEQPEDRSIGHAYSRIHRWIMHERPVPILPIMLNTYFPPNQPSPARCYRLGQAVARAIATWPQSARVGVVASGGLTHFVVDADFDRRVLDALAKGDADTIGSLPTDHLNSGSSEIRNWLAAAGAVQGRRFELIDYAPAYRSEAGSGCGIGFARWN